MKYPALILAAGIALIAAAPVPQATPLPTPPPLTGTAASPAAATATPSPSPSATPFNNLLRGRGRGRHEKPDATPTPPVPTRVGLDGVWEIQIQNGAKTTYEHMTLYQSGDTITGFYLNNQKDKKYPLTGVLDPQHNIRLIVARPDGTTILLEAQVEGTTDMLGMFTDSKERVPFTASYRAKEKFFENINAGPGGMGGLGSGGP